MSDQGGTVETGPSAVPAVSARLVTEIPKPRDWQLFQRNCVILFRAELGDPNAQEYGRNGQDQRGIDVLGRRFAHGPDHYVGIQCRLITKPLKEAKIEEDCRDALTLKAGLKEIIFATTAPDSTTASDAAIAVEKKLRAEGFDVTVTVYGWENLQTIIAIHDAAYSAFVPSVVSSSRPQTAVLNPDASSSLADEVAARVVAQLQSGGIARVDRDLGANDKAAEDPALHAKIDTFRDLYRNDGQAAIADAGLRGLLEQDLSAKTWAKFRILTNLGAVSLDIGKEEDAASYYEAALKLRPDDPNAIANLALMRTVQRRCEEAMTLARKALAATPRVDAAVAYLLQAAALGDWQGDPETLVPPELAGAEPADIGLAEFYRRREIPGWEQKTLEISARHVGKKDFDRINALAILSLALKDGLIAKNGQASVSRADLERAANEMTALTEKLLAIRDGHHPDLIAYLNNAAILLRLADRESDCEVLLKRGIAIVGSDPLLLRLLALCLAAQGRRNEAFDTLRISNDIENRLFSADLLAVDRPADAIQSLKAVDTAGNIRLEKIRLRAIGEVASRIKRIEDVTVAIDGLRALDPGDITASLYELRKSEISGADAASLQAQLIVLIQAVPDDADLLSRLMIAEEAMRRDLPTEAVTVLRNHVDLSRSNPAAVVYIQALGGAREDKEFRETLAAASPSLRDLPELLWTAAAHAWNVGDIEHALTAIQRLLDVEPDNGRARLFKVECLIRLDKSVELIAELDRPLEHLSGLRLRDRFRLASLLQHLGYPERAVALAYRLFLENRDNSRAWTTLSILVIEDGIEGRDPDSLRWRATQVADDMAVNLEYEDGSKQYVIVEPDKELRNLDTESWEPGHPLIAALLGLKVGDSFVDPSGRNGKIVKLQHKYVSRSQQVMLRHQERFPGVDGFRSISVDPAAPNGLNGLIEELKSRREWVEHETEQYLNGPLPLSVFAHRVGCDTIDAADGVVQNGYTLKVSTGTEEEREASERSVRRNRAKGCVTDLQTFHTVWRLGITDAVTATAGRIHIPQSVIDHLKVRREGLQRSRKTGSRSGRYEDGKLVLQEVPPEIVQGWLEKQEAEIAWLEANATICPILLDENVPPMLRDHVRTSKTDILDALTVSVQQGLLFMSDDLPTRQFRQVFAGDAGAPLQAVLTVACTKNMLDVRRYTQLTADLIQLGCDHAAVNHTLLLAGLDIDLDTGQAPGPTFKALIRMLGGKKADPASHVLATAQFLAQLWRHTRYDECRLQASSLILARVIFQRPDFKVMLRSLMDLLVRMPRAVAYSRDWCIGHFVGL